MYAHAEPPTHTTVKKLVGKGAAMVDKIIMLLLTIAIVAIALKL